MTVQKPITIRHRVVLVYVFPVPKNFWKEVRRFLLSYKQYPPGMDHDTVIVVNGVPLGSQARTLFLNCIKGVQFFYHDNSGWDIGGYQALSRVLPANTPMFCCSVHAYFRKKGWLKRVMGVRDRHGQGVYGTLASYEIRPHFCTTGFLTESRLLSDYPPVTNKEERYEFEHGRNAFIGKVIKQGLPVRLVTWDGDYAVENWRKPENVYAKGDQSNCLTFFNHSDSYENSDEKEKIRRTQLANTRMKVAIIYLYIVGRSDDSAPPPEHYSEWSRRFKRSYDELAGNGIEHELWVVACGGDVNDEMRQLFTGAQFISYKGAGWDIGAHQFAMRHIDCTFAICFNTSTHFRFPGFLEAMMNARRAYGDGIFGPTTSNENTPHIRTTCWAVDPATFKDYPITVDNREKTFIAESSPESITNWYKAQGKPTIMVAPSGCWEEKDWRGIPNVFRRGDQSQVWIGDRHVDWYAVAEPELRAEFERRSDMKAVVCG